MNLRYILTALALPMALVPAGAYAAEVEDAELQREVTTLMEKARYDPCLIDMTYFRPLKPDMFLLRVFVERTRIEKTVVKGELETTVQNHEVRVLNSYFGNIAPGSLIRLSTVLAVEPSMIFLNPTLGSLEHSVVVLRKDRGRYILEKNYPCREIDEEHSPA